MQFNEEILSQPDDGLFVKLKSGQSISGVFRGEIYEFRQHFIKLENKSYECIGEGCQWCARNEKATFRFRINFITNLNGANTAMIFDQGKKTYKILAALHKDYPLPKHFVKITRNGDSNDTTYTILPIPKGEITPEKEKTISQIQLRDLKSPLKQDEDIQFEGDIPF